MKLEELFQALISEKLTGEFGQLESHLKSILNERRYNLTEIDKLRKDRSQVQIKKIKLAELLAQSREAIIERDGEIKKLKAASEEHERELEAAALEYDEQCEKNHSLVSTVSKLKEENEKLLDQIKTGLLVKQEREVRETNREAVLSLQLQGETDKVTGLQERLSNIETELCNLKEKYKHQREEIESKTEKIESLEVKLGKYKNVNRKLLIRKSEYKKAESILKKDFELYKKKSKQIIQRLQAEYLLIRTGGLSGNSDSKLLEESGEITDTTNTYHHNKKIEDYEESLKKIKSFKVPKLKRKEASSDPDEVKSSEIIKCGDPAPTKAPAGNSRTLFIANLNYEITSSQLTEFFSPFGLERVELPRTGSDSRKNKGCAWVTFLSGEEAGAAVRKTNKQYFRGRQLSVRWSNGKR